MNKFPMPKINLEQYRALSTEKEKQKFRGEVHRAQKTVRLMNHGLIIDNVIDELTLFKKKLAEGTLTRQEVGRIYSVMMELIETNRKNKGLFKDEKRKSKVVK